MCRQSCIYFCFALALSGCNLAPKYQAPTCHAPDKWKGPQAQKVEVAQFDNWWEVFQDETLNELEQKALIHNRSIEIAAQKIVEARSLAIVNGSSLYPQLTIDPSYTNTGQLTKAFIPKGIILPTPGTPQNNKVKPSRTHQFQYFLPIDLSFEIDLWGKLQNQYQSAVFSAQATEFDYQAILLTLSTDLASTYFQLCSLDSQISKLSEAMHLYEQTVALVTAQYNEGLVNYQNVLNAQLQLTNAQRNVYEAQRQRALLENMIATLIGIPASDFHIDNHLLKHQPPEIPIGLPSDILQQRPDVAREERYCASNHAQVGVAYASYFPSISLSGALGFSSPDLRQFLKWKSRYWQMGANGSQDVFDGGKNAGNVEVAWAQFRQASSSYQQTVLVAFQEVEDALSNIEFQSKQYDSLFSAAQASQKNAHLSIQRYEKGLVNYFEVINSENARLNADLDLISNLGHRYASTVQLIKALGGNWQQESK